MDNFTSNVTHQGYVYLLESAGFYKIGVAEDLKARISSIQSGTPHEVTIVDFFPSYHPYEDEQHLHEMWQKYHTRGEWFSLPAQKVKNRKNWFKTIVSVEDAEAALERETYFHARKVLLAVELFSLDRCKEILKVKSEVDLRQLISASQETLDPVLAYERGLSRAYDGFLRQGNTHKESVAKVNALINNH